MLVILRNVFICKCICMLSSLLVGVFLVTVITIFSFYSLLRESKPTGTIFFSTMLENLFSYKKQFQQHFVLLHCSCQLLKRRYLTVGY